MAGASRKLGNAVTRGEAGSSKTHASLDWTRAPCRSRQRRQNDQVIPWLRAGAQFPPIDSALDEPNGLLVAGGDLSPRRVLDAYRRGIFPWYSEGQPILWWSPDPRTGPLRRRIQGRRDRCARWRSSGDSTFKVDSDFAGVIHGCAAPRDGVRGTWITAEMERAYVELHRLGYAHSVEAWRAGKLAGGLYGIAIGRMFFGESMFAIEPDSSKVALVASHRRC